MVAVTVALATDVPGAVAPSAGGVDLPAVLEDGERGASPPPSLGCEPGECLVWWSDEVDHRETTVHGRLLVHEGRDELVAIDVDSGRVRWRQDHPVDSEVVAAGPPYRARLLDDHGLVLAAGPHVWFHDPATGRTQAETTLRGMDVTELARLGDAVVAVGRERSVTAHFHVGGLRAAVVDPDGEVRWHRPVERFWSTEPPDAGDDVDLREAGPLLATIGGALVGLDPVDGSAVWRRPDLDPAWVEHGDRLLVVDPDGRAVEFLHPGLGRTMYRLRVDGLRGARLLGPWVLVVDDERIRVHAPDARRDVASGEVPDGAPVIPDLVELPDRFVVVWPARPSGDRVELAVHRRDGSVEHTLELPAGAVDGGCCPQLHDLGDDMVRVVLGDGRQIVDVDVAEGTVHAMATHVGAWDVSVHGDLVVVYPEGGPLQLRGRDGAIDVRGASRLASVDPLIVHGAGGAMRLDDRLLRDR